MPVIAVVNRKGGSGKSTLAAHVAAWLARDAHAVMLGDIDHQQSSRAWLRRRDPALPLISPWMLDQKNMLRVPTGITHVVLDTPGGLRGFELARVVMFADAILLPVSPSMFDRESAAACLAEMRALPRVAGGRCRVAAVGMRIDARTRAAAALKDWTASLDLPLVGVLRETQNYVRCLERGLTLFDVPPPHSDADLAQWAPVLEWLRDAIAPPPKEPTPPRTSVLSRPAASAIGPRDPVQPPILTKGPVLTGGRVLRTAPVPAASLVAPEREEAFAGPQPLR